MVKKLLTLSLLLMPVTCFAEETVITMSGGAGYTLNQESSIFNIGVETYFRRPFFYKLETGFWADNQDKHSSAFYSSVLGGVRLGTYRGFNANGMFGVLVHTAPDALLSTPFQFTEEVNIGYKEFQLGLKHISNAGIAKPNLGRDYIYFRYVIPIF